MIEKALIQPYIHPLIPIPTRIEPKGRLIAPVKCLLCDLYGTLFISSSGDIGLASSQPQQIFLLDQLLARYNQDTTAKQLRYDLTQAIQNQHILAREKGITHPEVDIETVWQEVLPKQNPQTVRQFAVEYEMITNPVWPMPGVAPLLSTCRNNGILLGIISNAQFYTKYLFSWLLEHGPDELGFDSRLCIYSYKFGEAKPSATLFERARKKLERLSIAPTNVAFIGNDMRKDIVPAHKAGFQTILFAGDQRSLRLLEVGSNHQTVEPNMVVTQLTHLTSYLQDSSLIA